MTRRLAALPLPVAHAAVVARELEIPCVGNTRDGAKAIRTGDRVRAAAPAR